MFLVKSVLAKLFSKSSAADLTYVGKGGLVNFDSKVAPVILSELHQIYLYLEPIRGKTTLRCLCANGI